MKPSEVTLEMLNAREIRDDERTAPRVHRYGGGPVLDAKGEQVIGPRMCGELIHEGRASYNCSRKAEFVVEQKQSTGTRKRYLCKPHLTGKKRSYATDATRREKDRAAKGRNDEIEERLDKLAERLGVRLLPYSRPSYRFSDPVRVSETDAVADLENLEALADRLEEAVTLIEGLADQQAMADDWYKDGLARVRGEYAS